MSFCFRLKVTQFDAICQFELTWGQGQCLTARLAYPSQLDELYRDWQQAYLNFYKSRQQLIEPIEPISETQASPLRARGVASGGVMPNADWKARLDDAEKLLLRGFQNWLWQGELREISKAIALASQQLEEDRDAKINVFLSCDPIDLVRLPWETWEITDDLAAFGKIRIVRSPMNIRSESATGFRSRWKRARILAICCDDMGLNLHQEKQILKTLEPLVQVEFIGWSRTQSQASAEQLQQSVLQAIADPQGWDILFFAGHSDETQLTGGRLALAPGVSMTIDEMKPALMIAKQQGLQLAMFNSCSGLRIAEALIDLGLNQVLIMRERIHNQVAQAFLVQFARSLASFQDTQDAVRTATQWLKENHNQRKYPSAYLVPSLFCRPGSLPIQLVQPDWRQWIGVLLPRKRWELIALALVSLLSLLPFIQLMLLDQRLLVQAQYRQWTDQMETHRPPELALIQIDDDSIQRDRSEIVAINPMSQKYIARLIDQLVAANVKVIGLDYVLDSPDPDRPMLAKSVKQATDRQVRFVFAKTATNQGGWLKTPVEVVDPRNFYANAVGAQGSKFHMPLQVEPDQPLTLPYWLARLHQHCVQQVLDWCQAGIAEQEALARAELAQQTPQLNYSPISSLAYGLGRQFWFHPITDFSIPPTQSYTAIPAWKLLYETNTPELQHLSQQTALIASGGYEAAGLVPGDDLENFVPPLAVQYWYQQQNPQHLDRKMTGGENLAYLFDQILQRRFVVPIPDLLMVWLAAIVAKAIFIQQQKRLSRLSAADLSRHRTRLGLGLIGGSVLYAGLSLQLYVSSLAILVPIVLPLSMVWLYLLPLLKKLKRS